MFEELLVVWLFVGIFGGVTVLCLGLMIASFKTDEAKTTTDRAFLIIKPFIVALVFAALWPAIFGLFGVNLLYWMLTGKNMSAVDKLYSL